MNLKKKESIAPIKTNELNQNKIENKPERLDLGTKDNSFSLDFDSNDSSPFEYIP